MPFEVVLNYLKNSGVPNLVHTLDDSFRDETFNGILDYLRSISPQFDKRSDQQIIAVIADDYRRKHNDWLEREYKEKQKNPDGRPLIGQMELIVQVIDDGSPVSLSEYNPTFKRPVVNLEKKVKDYIRRGIVSTSGGKQTQVDTLEIIANYQPASG